MISLIAAMSENRVIGAAGDLPWHLPDDLKYFMQMTRRHYVIMGRKTWESMNSALKNRTNIVVTHREDYDAPGATVVHSLDDAIRIAPTAEEEVFIIGGGEVFREALPLADRVYLTVVHANVKGDVTFPKMHDDDWTLVKDERHEADDRHAHAFSFRVYDRVGAAN